VWRVSGRGSLPTGPAGSRDVSPSSSRHGLGHCSVFGPLKGSVGEERVRPTTTCRHLRIGTSDTWRLYPRCAIGDQGARDRYLEDRLPV